MSCYFCDAKPGKPHMVDCPSDGRDPWAEEVTQPDAETSESPPSPASEVYYQYTHRFMLRAGGRYACLLCGREAGANETVEARCPGDKGATAAPLVLSARGVATGWREVRPGVWVLDE